MPQFDRHTTKFLCTGVYLGPVDLVPPTKFPRLLNVRVREPGIIQARFGISPVSNSINSGGDLKIGMIRRLNEDNRSVPGFTRVLAAGTAPVPGSTNGTLWSTTKGASAVYGQQSYSDRNFGFGHPFNLASPGTVSLSGRPTTSAHQRPGDKSQSWLYVADNMDTLFTRLPKINTDPIVWFWGIAPPDTDPIAALNGAGNLTGTFTYRRRYRSFEGAFSNSGVLQNDGTRLGESNSVTAVAQQIDVKFKPPAADNLPDPQITIIDVFRKSDTLGEYRLLISLVLQDVGNGLVPGASWDGTYIHWADNEPDLNIAAAELLEEDNDVPWPSVQPGGEPTRVNMPYVWGPFQGSLFGCGDPNRPGYVSWTKSLRPDSAPAVNNIEVTSPSEQLMNGFVWDGRCWVFSSERLFAIFPNFASIEVYDVVETTCGRGLQAPWAFCVGPRIWFLSKDGIFETDGGPAISITDKDLYWLFPHGDVNVVPSVVNNLHPPNLSDPLNLRMEYHKGYVYFFYIGLDDGLNHCLVYDTSVGGWFPDDYGVTVGMAYSEEGRNIPTNPFSADDILFGGTAQVYISAIGGDAGQSFNCNVRTFADDFGDPRAQKLFGDVLYEFDLGATTITLQGLFDNESVTEAAVAISTGTGRTVRILDVNDGLGRLARNMNLDFSWSINNSGQFPQLYSWQPSAAPKPDVQAKRVIDWHQFIPDRYEDAYVTGIKIWADTEGQNKVFQVWADEANTGITRTINCNGETEVTFSWPAFKGRLGRLVLTSTVAWRVFKWKWEAQPEAVLEPDWDTNWRDATPSSTVGYVTGIEVTTDTLGQAKTLIFQSELEGVVTAAHTPVEGTTVINSNGRLTTNFSFTPPFRANQLRMLTTDQVPGRLYDVHWFVQDEPPTQANWQANWSDFGYAGAKFFQGMRIDADTQGVEKTVLVEWEGGSFTVAVNHSGRRIIPYSFDPPVVGHLFRIIPQDANKGWLYKIDPIFNVHPETGCNWETQVTAHDLPGYQHERDFYFSISAPSDVNFWRAIDGVYDGPYTLAATGSIDITRKRYLPVRALKGKLYKYKMSSCDQFRVYVKDCEVRVKAWGDPGPYKVVRPFGDVSFTEGARI